MKNFTNTIIVNEHFIVHFCPVHVYCMLHLLYIYLRFMLVSFLSSWSVAVLMVFETGLTGRKREGGGLCTVCITHYVLYVSHIMYFMYHTLCTVCITHYVLYVSHIMCFMYHTLCTVCITHYVLYVSHIMYCMYHTLCSVCIAH